VMEAQIARVLDERSRSGQANVVVASGRLDSHSVFQGDEFVWSKVSPSADEFVHVLTTLPVSLKPICPECSSLSPGSPSCIFWRRNRHILHFYSTRLRPIETDKRIRLIFGDDRGGALHVPLPPRLDAGQLVQQAAQRRICQPIGCERDRDRQTRGHVWRDDQERAA